MTLQIFGVRLYHELTEEYASNGILWKKNILSVWKLIVLTFLVFSAPVQAS